MNMYGIPMIGADICGFQYNTTVELCSRWSSLGAFYPFSRNHNDFNTIEQDPAILGPNVTKSAKDALELRYTLLPHLYTLFYHDSISGDPVIRALFFENPEDATAQEIDTQFLWGSSIMIIPILEEGSTSVNAYFPVGEWYDIRTRQIESHTTTGEEKKVESALEDIKVVFKAGIIIPTQDGKQTTDASRQEKFRLIAGLDNGRATGDLFWDDGDSLYTTTIGAYNLISFDIQNNNFVSMASVVGYDTPMPLDELDIVGVNGTVTEVLVDTKPVTPAFNKDGRLTLTGLGLDLKENILITWK
jgi:lysosomal alpha-glucosidase